jgi:DNA-binding response OmpR family regulator
MSPHRWIAFVVDDEPMIAITLKLILLAQGFDARSFTNPLDALSAAHSMPPDLLISDVMMPYMNGYELAIQVMLLHRGCKVLLFTGQTTTEDLHSAAMTKGYDFDVLTKPVPPKILLATIEALFERQNDAVPSGGGWASPSA